MGIKKDPNTGLYEVSVYKRLPHKPPMRLARRGIKTKAAAEKVRRELIAKLEMKAHMKVIPSWRQSVFDFYNANETRTQKTMDNFLVCIKAHTFRRWGGRPIDKITTMEIRDLVSKKLSDKSPSHRKNMLKFIRWVFNHAFEQGVVDRNPVPDMKFKVGEKLKTVLTQEQVRLFLNKAKEMNVEWYSIWAMATYTGMRNGELYALTWDKVNLKDRQIRVDCSWSNKDGFKTTKTGNDRIVEIAPPLLQVLKSLKLQSSDTTFVLPRIDKWDKGEQARSLRMFLLGMGLPAIRFHDLRATWATIMLTKGVEPIKVMAMGGWKEIKTMRHYIRLAGVDIQGITDKLDLHNPNFQQAKVVDFRANVVNCSHSEVEDE